MNIFFRYGFSGLAGFITNIGVLYLLTDGLGVYYLFSTAIALMVAISVGFSLQKMWVFKNMESHPLYVSGQFIRFFLVSALNIGINTVFMYFMVEYLGLWYIAAQVLSAAIIAGESFFLYRLLVFKHTEL